MSASVADVRAALAAVTERLAAAHHLTSTAQASVGDAIAVLAKLERTHHEPLLPAELQRADQALGDGLGMIDGASRAVAAFDALL